MYFYLNSLHYYGGSKDGCITKKWLYKLSNLLIYILKGVLGGKNWPPQKRGDLGRH